MCPVLPGRSVRDAIVGALGSPWVHAWTHFGPRYAWGALNGRCRKREKPPQRGTLRGFLAFSASPVQGAPGVPGSKMGPSVDPWRPKGTHDGIPDRAPRQDRTHLLHGPLARGRLAATPDLPP